MSEAPSDVLARIEALEAELAQMKAHLRGTSPAPSGHNLSLEASEPPASRRDLLRYGAVALGAAAAGLTARAAEAADGQNMVVGTTHTSSGATGIRWNGFNYVAFFSEATNTGGIGEGIYGKCEAQAGIGIWGHATGFNGACTDSGAKRPRRSAQRSTASTSAAEPPFAARFRHDGGQWHRDVWREQLVVLRWRTWRRRVRCLRPVGEGTWPRRRNRGTGRRRGRRRDQRRRGCVCGRLLRAGRRQRRVGGARRQERGFARGRWHAQARLLCREPRAGWRISAREHCRAAAPKSRSIRSLPASPT